MVHLSKRDLGEQSQFRDLKGAKKKEKRRFASEKKLAEIKYGFELDVEKAKSANKKKSKLTQFHRILCQFVPFSSKVNKINYTN